MSKQDRQGARTPADLERKYNFGQTFAEVYGLVRDAQTAAENAANAVEGLDRSLDHEEIFNRLTKNGEVQGIYRGDNDDIYINASYIRSGTIAAEFIDAENLQVKAANITGLLSANQIKMGGMVNFYESLEDDSDLAGFIGYVTISSPTFNGPALGIVANTYKHATVFAPLGNLVAGSYGDVYVQSDQGGVRLFGKSMSFNDVEFGSVVSDRKMKEDINYDASEKLIALFDTLRPVTFKMKDNNQQQHIGFIAQDVAASVESAGLGNALVVEDCRGVLNLNYSEITAALVAKVQQLESRLEGIA